MIDFLLRNSVKLLLRLRYRIRIRGIEAVRDRSASGILFLPTHPALIDPVILAAYLNRDFRARFIADQDQVDRPVIRTLAKRIGVATIPNLAAHGAGAQDLVTAGIERAADGLKKRGENWVVYPAGHLLRTRLEKVRGNSGAHTLLQRAPGARVVLIRTRGLWGSDFSWAKGSQPRVVDVLKRGAVSLLLSGLVFAPRREVSIELIEPDDLPRDADRDAVNKYLDAFFNENAPPNTYVPHTVWEGGGARVLPDPTPPTVEGDLATVSETTRSIVMTHLSQETGVAKIDDDAHVGRDLGMDSLARADLVLWLESQFGFTAGDVETLQTVRDVLLAASGQGISSGAALLKPVPDRWFAERRRGLPDTIPKGETINRVFLAQAAAGPDRVVVADQAGGAKTYRDLIASVMALRPIVERLPGDAVGIMLPASVAADVFYLAALFSGKTPVMVNWTVGARNVVHSLENVGVRRVITARALVKRLEAQGVDFGQVAERFVYAEEIASKIGLGRKICAALMSRLSWRSLRKAKPSPTAVVLFTSGSESLPKSVPLSHENMLTNVRDVTARVSVRGRDSMIGFLPPFHSFGITATVVLPLCLGVRVVYHPNPTEVLVLARMIEAYKCTVLMGTPTFFGGILRVANAEQLATLRLAVTGAEKCPGRIYDAIEKMCPQATILEGYGVTECSPIISVNEEHNAKRQSIGRVMPSVEYAIVDPDTRVPVVPGESGVLLVRGPSVFAGYINYDGPSPFVAFDGKPWYRTGDMVREDADGVLTFAGRLKRFVKLGGEMISLPAIEAVLLDRYGGESDEGPCLAVLATASEENPEIVLFTTRDLDRETVNRSIRDAGLSPLHNIRRVERIAEMPLLGTGKTDYRRLQAMLATDTGGH